MKIIGIYCGVGLCYVGLRFCTGWFWGPAVKGWLSDWLIYLIDWLIDYIAIVLLTYTRLGLIGRDSKRERTMLVMLSGISGHWRMAVASLLIDAALRQLRHPEAQ